MHLEGALWVLDIDSSFPALKEEFWPVFLEYNYADHNSHLVERAIAVIKSSLDLDPANSSFPNLDAINTLDPPSIGLPSLEKSYFNNPKLSDLSLVLNDRAIPVHKIILCRGSDYFEKLLTGNLMEGGAKTVELHGDLPEAAMAMLRFIYGLSYEGEGQDWANKQSLVPHAQVYIVAEKYQVQGLKDAVIDNMLWMLLSGAIKEDLPSALRIIFAGTPHSNDDARLMMVKYCVSKLRLLRKQEQFATMLAETPELGAAMLGHDDHLPGAWAPVCACGGQPSWCGFFALPECSGCDREVEWVEHGWNAGDNDN